MKILVLNGSPKGQYSTTLHTCLFLEKKFPGQNFKVFDVGKKIRSIEKDFSEAKALLEESDVILFCYPVYTFLVPSQLHRFIELMKEHTINLAGKYATQLTTSKHFYDTTAHAFIKDNCLDLGLSFIDGLSADMDDLLTDKGQKQAVDWFKLILWEIERGKGYASFALASKEKSFKAVVVADYGIEETKRERLSSMVDHFRDVLPFECDVVDISKIAINGGCMSCFSCAKDGKCIYPDGFDDFLRNNIHKHDAIIYAFSIKDHSMGSRFKMYDDRQFCNGHRTATMGTPFGYIIEGEYSNEKNLQTVLEARAQVGGNYLAGVACSIEEIQSLSEHICFALDNEYCPPQNFYGVGGMKIFRDLIYKMRGLMRADHKFFKSHGQYDFPQKQWKTSYLMYLIGWLMNTPKIRKKMGSKINDGMISEYKKVVEKIETE